MKILSALLVFTSAILIACTSIKKMNNENNNLQKPPSGGLGAFFDTQGHRGCRGLMPENTIPAMLNALGLGVTTLEMDAVITKDKKVILSHEPFFNHEITTKPGGNYVTENEERSLNIFQMNYEEVKQYDVGMKPHPRFPGQQNMKAVKPLLADVFDSVSNYMKMAKRPYPFFNIETKTLPVSDNLYHPGPNEFVDLLMQVIKEKGMEQHVTIQSFDFRTLQYLHKNYPDIPTVMLIEESDKTSFESQLKKLGFTANVYSPHFSLVTEELVKKCHSNNMRIIPWTVNDKIEIDRLKQSGVDGIISDYPDLFN
jgi:glycerophosphoryl diester phosphodiesterase